MCCCFGNGARRVAKMKISKHCLSAILAVAAAGSAVAASVNDSAKNALLMALDDEYKAYATYAVVIEKFGQVRPFLNIIQAEENHIDSLKTLMFRYDIVAPSNPYLMAENRPTAPETLTQACQIGVQAEISNAALYENKLLPMVAGYDDIGYVFKNLRDASQLRHLRAFERCATQ